MQFKRAAWKFRVFALALSLFFCAAAAAGEKTRSAGPEMATLWPTMMTFVVKVDGVKPPKFPLLWTAITPGEHVVEIRFEKTIAGTTFSQTYKIRATFAKGHTYCWQQDEGTNELFFNDLGEGVQIPKTGWFTWSEEYRQAALEARNQPAHPVRILPKSEW